MEWKLEKHIDTAIISRSPKSSFGYMYTMHRYWSKKSPDIISQYIENYTKPGEIIIDPFCGSGIVISEAIRLGRKAIGIDLNPMASFIANMTLLPINLSNLYWFFQDIKENCREVIYELFKTKCNKCGRDAVVDFYVKNEELTDLVAYRCGCNKRRLYKEPVKRDFDLEKKFFNKEIPFWYPENIRIPIIREEKFKYLHELFTKRNLIALSTILNSINKIGDEKANQIMKLAFTAALDKCSKLKPLSYKNREEDSFPNLQESWVANRFYMPKKWLEVNPWQAFERSFNRIYEGKKESNDKLKYVIVGSSFEDLINNKANYIIYNGSSDTIINKNIPNNSVHYVLTDPPFIDHIQYLALSTFWGAWMKFNFNYDEELIVNKFREKTISDYNYKLNSIFKATINVLKPERYINIFHEDVRGPYLHNLLKLLIGFKILPEKIIYQPPASSFIKKKKINGKYTDKGNYGSFIIRGRLSIQQPSYLGKEYIKKRIFKIAQKTLEIRSGKTNKSAFYKSLYNSLDSKGIQTISNYNADKLIEESLKDFAIIKRNEIRVKGNNYISNNDKGIEERIEAAILDAKSLNSDSRHQVYQRVLNRFQKEGITIDDIRSIADKVDKDREKVKKHRKDRLLYLLKLLGDKLKYRSVLRKENDEVIWNKKDKKVLFIIKEDEVEIKASRTSLKKMFDIGTITNEKLESSLIKWCENNPTICGDLKNKLNPMNEIYTTLSSFNILKLKVINNKEICDKHYLIRLKCLNSKDLDKIIPGQFFHIICDPNKYKIPIGHNERKENISFKKKLRETLPNEFREINKEFRKKSISLHLRRPFSAHRIYYKNFESELLDSPIIIPYEFKENIKRDIENIDILYKDVGRGTKNLSRIRAGTLLNAIGPIGNGFNIKNIKAAIIVAGGIGAAPLVALAEQLRYYDIEIYLYLGASKKDIFKYMLTRSDTKIDEGFANGTSNFLRIIKKEFRKIGVKNKNINICTDDGSVGKKSLVSKEFESGIKNKLFTENAKSIFTCGPSDMLKEVSRIASENNIPCQVLLEERMACGVGACYSCTCNIRNKEGEKIKKRVCVDGPVFESREIIWQY